jgi:hypothetical protein
MNRSHISQRLLLVVILIGSLGAANVSAQKTDPKNQDTTSITFGKGLINKYAEDSTWYTKISFRFQTRYDGFLADLENVNDENSSDRFYVRRARIKGDGWATKSRKFRYKFEYDVNLGFVLDAVLKWNFTGNWELWFGQTKLPGNMERVISSQKMQLVDRSLLNSGFTLDRDAGIQLRNTHKVGEKFIMKEKFAFSQGEGLNQVGLSQGHGYTARIELFPFGKFAGSEYVSSDLKRNATPKLMLAVTADYNMRAARTRGQRGAYIFSDERRDLQTLFADAHFKYRGLSVMIEYANRQVAEGSPVFAPILDDIGNIEFDGQSYYTGQAINIQVGKLLSKKSNPSPWELAARYTQVDPERITENPWLKQYGIGCSKYIVGHNLKMQSDINLLHEEGSPDQLMFRLQTEFNF